MPIEFKAIKPWMVDGVEKVKTSLLKFRRRRGYRITRRRSRGGRLAALSKTREALTSARTLTLPEGSCRISSTPSLEASIEHTNRRPFSFGHAPFYTREQGDHGDVKAPAYTETVWLQPRRSLDGRGELCKHLGGGVLLRR